MAEFFYLASWPYGAGPYGVRDACLKKIDAEPFGSGKQCRQLFFRRALDCLRRFVFIRVSRVQSSGIRFVIVFRVREACGYCLCLHGRVLLSLQVLRGLQVYVVWLQHKIGANKTRDQWPRA